MEMVSIQLGNDQLFDEMVHGGLPEGGDLTIVTKDNGTTSGRAIVCVTFTVTLRDGSQARAQATTSVRNFLMAAAAMRGRYGDDGILQTFDRVN